MLRRSRIAILAGASLIVFAQEPPVIRVPVRVVTVPTAVISPSGQFVRGLQRYEFRLFDNDRSQNPRLDYVEEPLSLAIVVQINDAVRAWLSEVRRVPSAVEALLLGETGEASLSTFSDEVTTLQHLSASTVLLDEAFASIRPGGNGSRCLDAVAAAAKQLKLASPRRRRAILLIGQSGDSGSVVQLRDVLRDLELNNIVVYSLVMPRVGKDLVRNTISISGTSGAFGRPDTGIMGTVDLGKLIPEIFRGAKAASGQDEVTVLTSKLGGMRIPFRKLRDLEDGIAAIGKELHTEYLLSYTPDQNEPGYHRIRVLVDRPDMAVRARPGYYVPASDVSP